MSPADTAADMAPAELIREARKLARQTARRLAGRGPDEDVRAMSYDVNDRRAQVFRRVADGTEAGTMAWIDQWVRTAREFDLEERLAGRPRPLRLSGVLVLEAILRNHWHDFKTGAIDPALSQIERATGLVRQTIVEAIRRLERAGFIGKVRRTELIEDPEPGGPRRRQINNAYFFDVADLKHNHVRQRFLQLYRRAKARLALRAKPGRTQPAPTPPARPPAPIEPNLAAALRRFEDGVNRSSPSPENGDSPMKGFKG